MNYAIIIEIGPCENGGDKEYLMVIADWVKIDRGGNITVKGKIVPDGNNDDTNRDTNFI